MAGFVGSWGKGALPRASFWIKKKKKNNLSLWVSFPKPHPKFASCQIVQKCWLVQWAHVLASCQISSHGTAGGRPRLQSQRFPAPSCNELQGSCISYRRYLAGGKPVQLWQVVPEGGWGGWLPFGSWGSDQFRLEKICSKWFPRWMYCWGSKLISSSKVFFPPWVT